MNKMISAFGAVTIAVVVGMTTFTAATAAPIAPAQIQVASDVEMARHRLPISRGEGSKLFKASN